MNPTRLGKYELRGTLGRGSMGLVYEAWDPMIARRVAIKTVRLPEAPDSEATELMARFRREAQVAGGLSHPNIVPIFDYGETDEVAYIVMEFIDGRSLKAVLEGNEPPPLPETARIMELLLAGLQYSHDNGIVHRDIKPANIVLTATGQVKIADFGIARIDSSSMTQAGAVLGTPAYMSPEQFTGQAIDRRTDIYSAGVVLYQMLTGERPFEGSMSSVMHRALNTVPPRPSEISVAAPPALDAVVARAMAKRPEDRFESAAAFARALSVAMDRVGAAAGDDHDVTQVARRAAPAAALAAAPKAAPAHRSKAPAVVVFSVFGLIAAAGSVWYWAPWRASAPPAPMPAQMPPQTTAIPPAPVPPPPSPPPPAPPQAAQAPPAPPTPAPLPPAPPPPQAAAALPAPPATAPSPSPSPDVTASVSPPAPEPAPSPLAAPAAPPAAAEPPITGTPTTPPNQAQETIAAASMLAPGASPSAPPPEFDLAAARGLAKSVPCSLLDISETGAPPRGQTLSGFVLPSAAFDSLQRRFHEHYAALDDQAFLIPATLCPILATVGEAVRNSREQGEALDIIAPRTPVPADERFQIGATPAGDTALAVDLFDEEGGVRHVLLRKLPRGSKEGVKETLTADKAGRYLAVAVAARVPLDFGARPPREPAARYLPLLERELARAAVAGGVRAEIAPVTIVAAVPRTPPSPRQPAAAAAISRVPGLNASRCADIVTKAQLGEGLSDADRAVLRTSCR